jgi:hypothetical protein
LIKLTRGFKDSGEGGGACGSLSGFAIALPPAKARESSAVLITNVNMEKSLCSSLVCRKANDIKV